jgi:hypothetical protein
LTPPTGREILVMIVLTLVVALVVVVGAYLVGPR